MKIAGNLISRNGLPTYSLPLVEMRTEPLVAATMKPSCCDRHGRPGDRGERNAAPESEQPQIEHEHGAEER